VTAARAAATPPTVSLGDVVDRIVRRWGVVVVCVVACAVLATGLGSSRPIAYEATAVLTVSPLSTDPFEDPASRVNIATEQEVVRSTTVARRVSDRLLGQPSPVRLVRDVRVTAPSNSQVMEVTVRAGSPVTAAERANAFAETYLEIRQEDADEVAQRFIDSLTERAAVLRAELEAAESGSAEALTLQQQLSVLADRQAQLETVALNPGRVISKAEAPTEPSSPGPLVYLAAGVVLGALTGIALALVLDRVDRTVHDPRRLASLLDEETLLETHTSDDPDEPFRRAMLILQRDPAYDRARSSGPGRDAASLPIVALIGVEGTDGGAAAERLVAAAVSSGTNTLLASAGDLEESAIDLGWPTASERRAWAVAHDLVVVDGTSVASTARRLVLAERADLTVVVVATDAHTLAVEDLLDGLHEVGCSPRLVLAVPSRATLERPNRRRRRSGSGSGRSGGSRTAGGGNGAGGGAGGSVRRLTGRGERGRGGDEVARGDARALSAAAERGRERRPLSAATRRHAAAPTPGAGRLRPWA
jgi:capsular polysaccharide biosynthesis protein